MYYQMRIRLDPQAFTAVISDCLAAHAGTLPESLALDGKFIREQIGLLSLVRHEDGTPIGITPIDRRVHASCLDRGTEDGWTDDLMAGCFQGLAITEPVHPSSVPRSRCAIGTAPPKTKDPALDYK